MKRHLRNVKGTIVGLLTTVILITALGSAPATHAGGEPPVVVDHHPASSYQAGL